MKIYKTIAILALSYWLIACSKSEFDYQDNNVVALESIVDIQIKPNHFQLHADGKAQIDIKPFLYKTTDSILVLDDRVNPDWITYYSSSGIEIERYFSTSDESLIGQTIEVYAMVNGISSNTVTFEIKEPLPANDYTEITFPVIFHVIQTKNDILYYGGELPKGKVDKLLQKMNNVFSGSLSVSPVGVDTKISFEAALYDPYGDLLPEPGINRLVVDDGIDNSNNYDDFIKAHKSVDWPFDKYLNVWLISDSDRKYSYFSYDVSRYCIPDVIYAGTDVTDMPQGLSLTEEPENWEPAPISYGLKFKSQLLNNTKVSFGERNDNDFMFYLGQYFGLLMTHAKNEYTPYEDDFCDDTFGYNVDIDYYKSNLTTQKEVSGGYFFVSENVMDDPTGLHKSISKDQLKRIRWIAENCPGRSAWKSGFALEGQ